MYFADYHTHSNFSGDCTTAMEDMIKRAVELGLNEIAFTDHVDYDYPDEKIPFIIDYDKYLEDFTLLKEKYRKDIQLKLGVEVGYQFHIQHEIEDLLSAYPFDFVICSSHAADRMEFSQGSFFKGKEQDSAYRRYFENVLEAVGAFQDYDVYGHLDFIIRYGNYADRHLSYRDYSDVIDKILKGIIDGGHGIEVNSSGYRYGLAQLHPQVEILKRYRQLGGEIITVGSDAHKPKDICSHFEFACQALKEAGFKAICTFQQRKPKFIDIDDFRTGNLSINN